MVQNISEFAQLYLKNGRLVEICSMHISAENTSCSCVDLRVFLFIASSTFDANEVPMSPPKSRQYKPHHDHHVVVVVISAQLGIVRHCAPRIAATDVARLMNAAGSMLVNSYVWVIFSFAISSVLWFAMVVVIYPEQANGPGRPLGWPPRFVGIFGQ